MKISFWIPAIVFYYVAKSVFATPIHAGTVLFTSTDLLKKCWTESDKALLRARLIMQDVLPDPDCIDFSKPDAVLTLLDYFKSCYNIVGVSTYGKVQNLMFLALSDALGGYLRGYALPLTKRAYYEGQVKYADAKKLYRLYDDIKCFLKTDGTGWAKPQKLCKSRIKAKPLVIMDNDDESPCNTLYTIEKKPTLGRTYMVEQNLESEETPENLKYLKCNLRNENTTSENEDDRSKELTSENLENRRFDYGNETANVVFEGPLKPTDRKQIPGNRVKRNGTDKTEQTFENFEPGYEEGESCSDDMSSGFGRVVIPLPLLEDTDSSIIHTIAVPFKIRPLRNVQSRRSAFVLEHYYIAAVKCLIRKSSKRDVKNFNFEFHSWVTSQVCPHLEDEEWYPAFGGIYRVIETIKKLGSCGGIKDPNMHDIGFIFSKGFEFEDQELSRVAAKDRLRDVREEFKDESYRPKKFYVYGVLVLLLVWICSISVCLSCCYAMKGKKSTTGSEVLPQPQRQMQPKQQPVKQKPNKCCSRGDDEPVLNFHFFVKFFKNKFNNSQEKENYDSGEKFKLKKANKELQLPMNEQCQKDGDAGKQEMSHELPPGRDRQNERNKPVVSGKVPTFVVCSNLMDTSQTPFHPYNGPLWPYHASYTQFDKHGKPLLIERSLSALKVKKLPVETLWKKQTAKSKGNSGKTKELVRRSKDNKMEKGGRIHEHDMRRSIKCYQRYSSSECTGSCAHSFCTTTNSSSRTQIQEEISTDTAKFFRRTMNRCKGIRHRVVEDTTGDSESEREISYSSESESTETTSYTGRRRHRR